MHRNGKFRLLFVSRDTFPPFRVDVSILFGQEMVKRGHCIDWLLQSADECHRSYVTTWNSCRVWVGSTDTGKSRLNKVKRQLLGVMHNLKMFNLAKKFKYDFIQVRDSFVPPLMALLISRIYGTKFVYWLSFPFPEEDIYSARKNFARYPLLSYVRGIISSFLLYKIILPKAHHVFVQSEQMKKDILAKGIPSNKMTPVPMGVSLEATACNELARESNCNRKIVLYLGAVDKIRRIDFLIRVFKKVLCQAPESMLFIVGGAEDPKCELDLKSEAESLNIAQAVVFTGFIPMQEARNYVRKADVCVSFINPITIFKAASPTKLIEYMAMGKPVVANEHPEQLSVISESGAGICVPYEEDAFKDAIVMLLKNTKKVKEMGRKGRRYVELHRTYEHIADIVENEYLHMLCEK